MSPARSAVITELAYGVEHGPAHLAPGKMCKRAPRRVKAASRIEKRELARADELISIQRQTNLELNAPRDTGDVRKSFFNQRTHLSFITRRRSWTLKKRRFVLW